MPVVYKVTNIITQEIYIGITKKKISERKRDHVWEAFRRNLNDKFHAALREFGLKNFEWEIIFTHPSYKKCAQAENQYIEKFQAIEYGYNIHYRMDKNAIKRINKNNYRNNFKSR